MTFLDRIAAHFGYYTERQVDEQVEKEVTRARAERDRMAFEEIERIKALPRDYERIANGTEAIARGQRWESFYAEEDGLRDMIASLRRDYFTKVGQLSPGDTDKLLALGMADKIAQEIERKVQSVIETGRIRANDKQHTSKIAGIRG